MTRAEWLEQFEDGQTWATPEGEQMEDLTGRLELRTIDKGRDCMTQIALDDATVVVAEGGWDFLHAGCTCGWCWEGCDPECPVDDDEEVSG